MISVGLAQARPNDNIVHGVHHHENGCFCRLLTNAAASGGGKKGRPTAPTSFDAADSKPSPKKQPPK